MTTARASITIDANTQAAINEFEKLKRMMGGVTDAMDAIKGAAAALGGVLGVGVFTKWIKGAIDATDALDDLSTITGVAIESLPGLQVGFKLSGLGAETLQSSMGKLSKSMADGNSAFEAMGLSTKKADGSLKSTREMLAELSDKFAGYKEGPEKAALAMEIFGKSGAEMLPLLNEGSKKLTEFDEEARRLGLTMSEDTVKQAAAFNDTLDKLEMGLGGLGRQVAAQLLPTLSSLTDEFFKTVTSGDRLAVVADAIGVGLKGLYSIGLGIAEVFSTVGKVVGAAAAEFVAVLSGDFKLAVQIDKEARADIESGWLETAKQLDRIWDSAGGKAVDSMRKSSEAADENKRTLAPLVKANDDAAKAAAKHAEEYKKLTDDIQAKTGAMILEAQGTAKLSDGQKLALKIMQDVQAGTLKLTDAEKRHVTSLLETMLNTEKQNDAIKESAEVMKRAQDAMDKYTQGQWKEVEALRSSNQQLEDQNFTLLYGEEAMVRRQVQQLRTTANAKLLGAAEGEVTDALREQAAELNRRADLLEQGVALKEAKAAQDAWKQTTDSIGNTLTEALMRGFESGKGFAQNLLETTVNMFKTLVLRPVISAVVNPVAGALTGLLGLPSAASAATGMASGAGLLGGLGNLGGLGSMLGSFGTAAGYGASALFSGNALGALSGGANLLGAGSIAEGLGMVTGVLGPISLGIGAIYSLISGMDDSGTPHTGALAQYSAAGGLQTSSAAGAFGMGFGGVEMSQGTAGAVGGIAKGIASMLDVAAVSFGRKAGFTAATAFADDSSKDGAWGGLAITDALGQVLVNWDRTRGGKWAPREFSDGEAGLAEYNQALGVSVREALDSIGLPGWATQMLDALGDAPSVSDLEQTVGVIAQLQQAFVGLNSYGGIFSAIVGASDEAKTSLIGLSGGIENLVAQAGSFVKNYYTEGEQVGLQARAIVDALASVGIDATAFNERSDLRAVLESRNVEDQAQREQIAMLLQYGDSFASITDYLEKNNLTLGEAIAAAPEVPLLQSMLSPQEKTAQSAASIATGVGTTNTLLGDIKSKFEGVAGASERAAAAAAAAAEAARQAVELARQSSSSVVVGSAGSWEVDGR